MEKKFRPSPDQLKLLEAFVSIEPNEDHTITRVCLNAGCSRNVWYRSLQNPDFVDWFTESIQKHVRPNLARIWGAMAGQAIKGDVSAAKLYAERWDDDYKPTTKSEQAHTFAGLKAIEQPKRAAESRRRIMGLAEVEEN